MKGEEKKEDDALTPNEVKVEYMKMTGFEDKEEFLLNRIKLRKYLRELLMYY